MEVILTNLSRRHGHRHALAEVSLRLGSGVWAPPGPNGSGKTTLLRIVATVLAPSSGSVRIGAVDTARDPVTTRRLIGYLPRLVLGGILHGSGPLVRVLADSVPLGGGRTVEPGLEDGYVALVRQEAAYG